MQNWDAFQLAALEYSRIKPRRAVASLTGVADQQDYALPEGYLSVLAIMWGDATTAVDEVMFTELMTASTDNTTQVWAEDSGTLHLSPTPEEGAAIKVVYLARHLPDEDTLSFPTVPAADISYVEDLEQAIILELEADEVSRGPVLYSLGQTQVSRVEALKDLRVRSRTLRLRVSQSLGEPFAIWR